MGQREQSPGSGILPGLLIETGRDLSLRGPFQTSRWHRRSRNSFAPNGTKESSISSKADFEVMAATQGQEDLKIIHSTEMEHGR